MQEGLKELEVLLDPYDWFYEVEAEARRYVVYVTYGCSEQNKIIPDMMHGKQVVMHFACAKNISREQFLTPAKSYNQVFVTPDVSGSVTQEDLESCISQLQDVQVPNLDNLCNELDRLERQVGSNILQDIFYECHDGKNAVTSLGDKYPEVKAAMIGLYDEYGFDTIYEELDG